MLEYATIQSHQISTHPQLHFGGSWKQVISHIIHLEFFFSFFWGKKNTDKSFFGLILLGSGHSPNLGVGPRPHKWEQQLLSPSKLWPQAEKHL